MSLTNMPGTLASVFLLLPVWAVAGQQCQPVDGIHIHQPQFHIIGSIQPGANSTSWPGGLNDANAVYQHHGLFHVMHQCDGGPAGLACGGGHVGPGRQPGQTWWHSWGHLVSRDLIHWRRLPDALSPPPYGTPGDYDTGEDCDGTLSFTPDGPVIMFGPSCDPPKLLGDAPIVGVARAANASDPEMVQWVKDPANPVQFDGAPCSFPGSIWPTANQSHWNMICAVGSGAWGRYTSASRDLHGPWKLQDGAFAAPPGGKPVGGSSGPSFLPLPNATAAATHVISDGSNAVFQYGTYDAQTEKLSLTTGLYPLDHGTFAWAAAGLADDDRVLAIGWVHATDRDAAAEIAAGCPRVGGIQVCGVQAISAVRVISFDPTLEVLLADLAEEYANLRNGTLFEQSVTLQSGETHQFPVPAGKGLAMDLEFNLTIPEGNMTAQLTVLAGPGHGVTLGVNVSAGGDSKCQHLEHCEDTRTVLARVTGNVAPTRWFEFPLPSKQQRLQLRVLVDRSIVEFFIAKGRAAFTARAYPTLQQTGVSIWSGSGLRVERGAAWEMGCGWV